MRADRSSRLFRSIFLAPRKPRSFQNSALAPEGLVPDVTFSTDSRLAICSALGEERAQDLQPLGLRSRSGEAGTPAQYHSQVRLW